MLIRVHFIVLTSSIWSIILVANPVLGKSFLSRTTLFKVHILFWLVSYTYFINWHFSFHCLFYLSCSTTVIHVLRWPHSQHSLYVDNSLKCYIIFLIGKFLAELTKEVFSDLEASKYQVLSSFFTDLIFVILKGVVYMLRNTVFTYGLAFFGLYCSV